jgi:hypothetical protein
MRKNRTIRRFLRLIEEDFKKGLMDNEKMKFRKLLDIEPETRKYLEKFKTLDKNLRSEGKKTIPTVDFTNDVAALCGIASKPIYTQRLLP